jgi:hypothetical protein
MLYTGMVIAFEMVFGTKMLPIEERTVTNIGTIYISREQISEDGR